MSVPESPAKAAATTTAATGEHGASSIMKAQEQQPAATIPEHPEATPTIPSPRLAGPPPLRPVQELISALNNAAAASATGTTTPADPTNTAGVLIVTGVTNPGGETKTSAAAASWNSSQGYYQQHLTQAVLRVVVTDGVTPGSDRHPTTTPTLISSPYSPELQNHQVYAHPQALQQYMRDMGLQDMGLQQAFDQDFDLGDDPEKSCFDWVISKKELQVSLWCMRIDACP
jgi:hypothetical protein